MAGIFQFRGKTRDSANTYVGPPKELIVNTDDWVFNIHDGTTPGGHEVGAKGDTPEHEWQGTKVRFKRSNLTWGEWIDLKSEATDPQVSLIRTEGDTQVLRVEAEGGDVQILLVQAEGDTQVNRVVVTGGSQNARVVTEGDNQVAAVQSKGTEQVSLVDTEGGVQVSNVQNEGATQKLIVTTEGGTQAARIALEASSHIGAIEDEGDRQIGLVQAAAGLDAVYEEIEKKVDQTSTFINSLIFGG